MRGRYVAVPGTLVVSIDTELAWGYHDLGEFSHLSADGAAERAALEDALALFERHDAGATWAVVGHLFHDACNGYHEGPAGWFDRDPGTSADADPLWYAPDVVDLVRAAPRQELGFHSYSHIVFDECTREIAISDFRRCRKLADAVGVEDPVFVFPRNRVGYLDELRDAGFRAYRESIVPWYEFDARLPRMAAMFADYAVNLTVPTFDAPVEREDGLVEVPGSLPLNPLRSRWFDLLGIHDARYRKLRSGVERAAERDEIFHVWTHLYEFPDRLNVLCDLLKLADNLGVDVMSMGELVEATGTQSG